MSAIQTWTLSRCDFVGSRELEKLIDASQHLSSLGFDIANNRVWGDAGEIGDVAVNDRLADDWLTAIVVRYLSNFVTHDRHDFFPFCELSASSGGRDAVHRGGRSRFVRLFGGRLLELLEREHNDRARCLAS